MEEIVPSFYTKKNNKKIEQFSNIYLTHCAQSVKIILTISNNPCKNMGDILEKGDEIMANDDGDVFDKEFDKEIKRSMEIAKKTMDLCIEPYIKELAIYKRALELACDSIRDMYCSDYCVSTRDERCNGKCCYEKYYNEELFLDQAKKEDGEKK